MFTAYAMPTCNPHQGGIAMNVSTAIERFFEYQGAKGFLTQQADGASQDLGFPIDWSA